MMRIFYEEWSVLFENRQLTIDDFNNLIDNTSNNKITICHFSTEKISESDLTCFLNVGFTNHYIILTKTKSLEERLFYIRRCAKEFSEQFLSLQTLDKNAHNSLQQHNDML